MSIKHDKAISTTTVVFIVIIIVLAAVAAYLAVSPPTPAPTTTTTQLLTTTKTITTTPPPPPPPEIKNPDTLVVATIGEPETLDPAWAYDTASGAAIFNIYETLIFFDGNRTDKFIPMLAEQVPSVENGLIRDSGKTYIFPIRKNIKFSNGNPLTPEDVEYSFERAMVQDRDGGPVWMLLEPLLGISSTRDGEGNIVVTFDQIDRAVEVEGDNVVFHLANPYPPFLSILSQTWSSIVDKEWTTQQPNEWSGTADGWEKYNNPETPPLQEVAMGTGPYKLERWEHGKEYSLIRNDDYWKGPAKIKRVVVKKVDEWSTRKLMFLAGDVDQVYVPREHIKELEGVKHIKVVKDLPTLSVDAIFFNFAIDPTSPHIWSGKLDGQGIPPDFFKDKDVRLGFTYAFDWDTYIRDVLLGEASQPATPVVEGLPFFNPNQEKYKLDLEKAKEHFQKAWNGEVWEKGFKLTILFNVGNEPRKEAAEMLKFNVESLNDKFQIYVRAVEWPTYLRDLVRSKLPLFLIGWLADYPDPHNFVHPFMHSQGAFTHFQGYSNPEVDRLIEEGIKTVDPAERQRIYYDLQRIYHEEVPSVPTVQPLARYYARDWVQGWYYNPIYPGRVVEFYYYALSKGY